MEIFWILAGLALVFLGLGIGIFAICKGLELIL